MTQMFRSATFKLTVWYLAVVACISLTFSVVVYHFAVNELRAGLTHQTRRIYENFPVFDGNPLLRAGKDISAGSHHIFWHLIYFNLLVLVLAGVASYYLARRTLQPIEAAHKRQQRFTADVSHELRTPLTSLKMNSEVSLLDTAANKTALRAALQSNLEDADKMERLINNLLRLTRLDADAVQASFGPLRSNSIVTNACQQVAQLAASKQISIRQTGYDAPIYGDQDGLTQLLVILLDNALKYSPKHSVIELKTSQGRDTTVVQITDHGQGIAPDVLPHVFDRFYRADASRATTSDSAGFGLGLSIAKLIADTHNGSITLSSRLGHGTTATVTLPQTTAVATKLA